MILDDYIKRLIKLRDLGFGDKELIYSRDDEGNSYHKVIFGGTLAYTNQLEEYYIEDVVGIDEDSPDFNPDDVNCICIN